MYRTKRKQLTLSKRAKGFPIRLGYTHILAIHQVYSWLKTNGLTDEDTDLGYQAIPAWDEPVEQAQEAGTEEVLANGLPCITWSHPSHNGWRDPAYTLRKTKTVRIRAGDIENVARMFRLVARFIVYGQVGDTLLKRADDLEAVPVMDQMVDAYRGEDK